MAKGNTSPLSLPIPIFTGENYDVWSIKMKTYFLSQDLWEIVNYENNLEITDSTLSKQQQEQLTEQQQKQLKEQQQEQLKESNENDAAAHFKQQQEQLKESKKKDAAALFILQQAVDDNIFRKISHAKKAKKAWDTLKKEFQGIPQTTTLAEGREPEDFKKYLPLYKNILEGDLKSVRELCDKDENALEARITVNLDTALHVAVGTGKANHIVEYLLNKMSMDQVSLKNKEGNTVLSVAAIVSNVRAASMILIKDKDQSLIHNLNNSKRIPLVEATRHGQKEMVNYLLQISMKDFDYNSATRFTSGVLFAKYLIIAEFYDLALDLLNHRPILATMTFYGGDSLLSEITRKPSAFPSGGTRKLPFREYFRFSKDTTKIGKTKLMHDKVIELVKKLCKVIAEGKTDYPTTCLILKRSLLLAAELGVCEIVEAIIKSYPDAMWFTNEKNQNLFHLAVMNRQEKVFNLVYQMTDHKHLLLMSQDIDKNNILHFAGKLAPENKLNVIAGAAFQMQRELQWYKEVENIVPADCKNEENCVGETPATVFFKSHKKLVTEGEQWMKQAATSSIVAATVTATLVFQAAFSGTGGYNKLSVFMTFGFSDALSLFSSIAAAIIFMSIITARYKQDDFLKALPRKFILGVVIMFISITSMMVAFGTTVYQIFYEKKAYLMLGLVGVSACLLMLLFMASQFSLIWHLFIYTYRPGLFSKPSN